MIQDGAIKLSLKLCRGVVLIRFKSNNRLIVKKRYNNEFLFF